jgi:3-oxoadipate enol-lactonase
MSVIILADEIVHYEVLGRGKPLVFLHGWVGSWRYWITSMQAISISYRAYALDLWGFGDTAKSSSLYTLEQQVLLIDQFLENMGIGKIALVGHGLGAIVSLLFVQRHPDLVDRLMVASLPFNDEWLTARFQQASPTDLTNWLLGNNDSEEVIRGEAAKADFAALQVSIEQVQSLNIPTLFSYIKTPCIFIQGENDPAHGVPRTEQISAMPDSTHYIAFEQSGHFPMLDEPTKYNRLLADFLSLDSGESPRQLQLKEEWKRRVR